MAYRPYPNRERALQQIDRHIDEVGPQHDAPARPMTPLEQKPFDRLAISAQAAGAALAASIKRILPPVDEYRLSTH